MATAAVFKTSEGTIKAKLFEQDRATAFCRLDRLERGIKFVLDFQHDAWRGFSGTSDPAPVP